MPPAGAILIACGAVALAVAAALFFSARYGPRSWKADPIEKTEASGIECPLFEMRRETAMQPGEHFVFEALVPQGYDHCIVEGELRMSFAEAQRALGFGLEDAVQGSSFAESESLGQGQSVTAFVQPAYEKYTLKQRRKWRGDERAECVIYKPIEPIITLEYSPK